MNVLPDVLLTCFSIVQGSRGRNEYENPLRLELLSITYERMEIYCFPYVEFADSD